MQWNIQLSKCLRKILWLFRNSLWIINQNSFHSISETWSQIFLVQYVRIEFVIQIKFALIKRVFFLLQVPSIVRKHQVELALVVVVFIRRRRLWLTLFVTSLFSVRGFCFSNTQHSMILWDLKGSKDTVQGWWFTLSCRTSTETLFLVLCLTFLCSLDY